MSSPPIRLSLFATLLIAAPSFGQATELINQQLAAKWKEQKLQPADKTSDAEFIRRVSLDIIGRIPTIDELQTFEKDTAADKRAKLVDKLLASEEYSRYWAQLWSNWLLSSEIHSVFRDEFRQWLTEKIAKNSSYQQFVRELLTATGKSNENGAVHFVLSGLGAPLQRPGPEWHGRFSAIPLTERVLRLFLGYRLHYDLPDKAEAGEWQKSHFWRVNVFFRQTDRVGEPVLPIQAKPAKAVLELRDDPGFNKDGHIFYEQSDGTFLPAAPIFLDGRKIADGWKGTRREALATLLTTHPDFAKAYVNRVWGEFFSRGLHERPVVDDFSSKHKVVHPELLDGLAKAFADSGYDTKKLIRSICLSDAYQLKSTSNATNAKSEMEVYFSRMPLRVLRPEQLIQSVVVAVQPRNADKLREQLRKAPTPLADGSDWDDRPLHEKIIFVVSVLNRRELQDALSSQESQTMSEAMKMKTGRQTFQFICLATLGRPATDEEYVRIVKALALPKGLRDTLPDATLQDVLWALLNSSEFSLNH